MRIRLLKPPHLTSPL